MSVDGGTVRGESRAYGIPSEEGAAMVRRTAVAVGGAILTVLVAVVIFASVKVGR